MLTVFDGHCDTVSACYWQKNALRNNLGHLDLERTTAYCGWAQFFALYASKERVSGSLWDVTQAQYRFFCEEVEKNSAFMVQCRTAQEIQTAWSEGKTAAILSVEGGELLECDPEKLEEVYRWGVRSVNLTWNFQNALSGSNAEGSGTGLTEQGKRFVRHMQDLGMLVDVSHLSDHGFWDVIDLARKPIWASHSNARAVCAHPRNLTDEQFVALIKNGGVAGLNLLDQFLGDDPTVDTLVRHIEHWCGLGGARSISLGGDWDGISGMPKGFSGVQDIGKLANRLLQLNYKECVVNGLFYQNLLRVVSEVCIT